MEIYFMRNVNFLIFILLFVRTIMTVSYSVRLIYYIYLKNLGINILLDSNEESLINYPMLILFLISVVIGSFLRWLSIPAYTILLPFLVKTVILLGSFLFLSISLLLLKEGLKNIGLIKIGNLFNSYLGRI